MYKHEKDNESSEMYLETILRLKNKGNVVKAIDVSNEMNFSRASVSRGISILREKGLVEVDNATGNILFTDEGEKYAEKIFHRHCVLTSFFISLGVDKKIAEDDACKIEHIISEETFKVIESKLKSN